MDTYRVIGVMSGSSLDGVDVLLCRLSVEGGTWSHEIERGLTVHHDPAMRRRLLETMEGSALDMARLHRDLGDIIGRACLQLLDGAQPDLIASHGHTLFHRPDEGLTVQLGCGARIAAMTGIATVCDFRTMDVALRGQGAPLVPIGERLLFQGTQAFLNLGGIANLSIHQADVIGYDVAPCNQALDRLAQEAGMDYDAHGDLARSGNIDADLLKRLNALDFYRLNPPRSLGREWFDAHMAPLIADKRIPLPDRLRTTTEHIASVIAAAIERYGTPTCLVTGGGAHNRFLMERIAAGTRVSLSLPSKEVIDFKEALIFALLGVLRLRGEPNSLSSVTGARCDVIGGAIYLPNSQHGHG